MQLMFLKLDGLRGESYAPRHIGEIEISGFTWGQPKGISVGSVAAGKASINDLTVFKPVDKTTPFLKIASANGQYFASGELTIEEVSERGSLLRTMIIKMKDIILMFVTTNGDTDSIEINFANLEMKKF